MNKTNEQLYNTTMKYNQKQEMLCFYEDIKNAQKINTLDELYKKIQFSNLDDKTVLLLQDVIELKVENMKLKGYNKAG